MSNTTVPLPETEEEIQAELAELDQLEKLVTEVRDKYSTELDTMGNAVDEVLATGEKEAEELGRQADDLSASVGQQAEQIATDSARQQISQA